MQNPQSPIIARVCKHATYNPHKFDNMKDMLSAKITNIHEDGSRSNEFLCIEDYQVPVYIVKDKYRKFEQRKDYIDERMCKKFSTSRARMAYNISKVLYGRADVTAELRQMKASPYVYGAEQTPPVYFKHSFFEKYPEQQNTEKYTMGAYDVETNVFSPEEEIIMAAFTFRKVGKAYLGVVRGWFEGLSDAEIMRQMNEARDKYLGDILKEYQTELIVELFDNDAQVVAANVAKFHEWEPDWVTSWNASFDMKKNEESLKRFGYDPVAIYSDPRVPPEYRHYKLDEGRTHKVKENGDKTPLENQERFPTIRCPATWQWADAMSFYAIKRAPKGKLDSYALQAISEREKVPGKLYTEEGSHLKAGSLDWHKYMQKNHKFIYCMYCVNDNFVIEDINEKTQDFALSLPMLIKSSEFFNYPSQPSIISDELSFIAKENGYVWGCTGNKKGSEFGQMLPDLGDWIALLETEKNAALGVALFNGLEDVISRGRGLTDDVDVTGAYPTATVALNISNKTTRMEVTRIQGANRMKFREIAVNYASSPEANAIGLCYDLFRFPKAEGIQETFESHLLKMGKEDVLNQLKKTA